MAGKKSSKHKVAGSQILQKHVNVRGIGSLGHSHRLLSPQTVNPKYGGSGKVSAQIIKGGISNL